MHVCVYECVCVCRSMHMNLRPLPKLGGALSQCHSGRIGNSKQDTRQWITKPPCFQAQLYLKVHLSMVPRTSLAYGFRVEYWVWFIWNPYFEYHRLSESKIKAQEVQEGKNSISFVNNCFCLTKELGREKRQRATAGNICHWENRICWWILKNFYAVLNYSIRIS